MPEGRLAGRPIPSMVFGDAHVALPTPLAEALIDVAVATEDYFMGANGDTAKAVSDALDRLYAQRGRFGM